MIPSARFLSSLTRQAPAPDLLTKLQKSFPQLGARRPTMEVCLFSGGFPQHLDCSAFAFGSRWKRFAKSPIPIVLAYAQEMRLNWLGAGAALVGALDEPVIAVLGTASRVEHFSLAHFPAHGPPELWVSKFGEGFPLLEHPLGDLNGGGYGPLLGFLTGSVERSGTPSFDLEET